MARWTALQARQPWIGDTGENSAELPLAVVLPRHQQPWPGVLGGEPGGRPVLAEITVQALSAGGNQK